MTEEIAIVDFYIHHNSGKFKHKQIKFETTENDIDRQIEDRTKKLSAKFNKEISHVVIHRDKLHDTPDEEVHEDVESPQYDEKIMTKSVDMSAEDAIKYIEANDSTHLKSIDFVEGEKRKTVNGAYNKKVKQ